LARYYYLVATLPFLFYDTEKALSHRELLDLCRQHISPGHFRLLLSAAAADPHPSVPSCKTLDLWREWEASLRNELVRLRAKKGGFEAERYVVGSAQNMDAQQAAREAFEQESPLEAEDALNRARWAYLDELEAGHYFDIDKILIYTLRLQILERKALFDEQKGREMFYRIYAEITSPGGDN
jgi:hypothetical protein